MTYAIGKLGLRRFVWACFDVSIYFDLRARIFSTQRPPYDAHFLQGLINWFFTGRAMSCSVYDKAPLPFFPVPSLHSVKNLHKLPVRLCAHMLMQNFSYILTETSMLVGKLRCSILNLVFWEITFNSKKCYKTLKKKLSTLQPLLSVVIQITVTVGCHTFFFYKYI